MTSKIKSETVSHIDPETVASMKLSMPIKELASDNFHGKWGDIEVAEGCLR